MTSETTRELVEYGEWYYAEHFGNEPYHRGNPFWGAVFGRVADAIVAELAPRTVLDTGCAIGFLVEALRERGVEAYGVDVSEYAIEQMPPEVRRHCRVASVIDELDRDYDLIACIEVLEHVPAEEADLAVANLARHTGAILFSSSPDDFAEPTHLNVRPTDYWIGLFARHGFFRDVDFDASFVAPQAVLLRRSGQTAAAVARAYERAHWRLVSEARALREEVLRLTDAYDRARDEARAPRDLRRLLVPPGSVRRRVARRIIRSIPGVRRQASSNDSSSDPERYRLWLEENAPRREELRHEASELGSRPLISIVMPVHETPPELLRAAVESVRAQVYDRWELCIADDATTRAETRALLEALAGDERIKTCRLEEQGGIAAASNAALALASGEFVGLLDHDDELKPEALFEVAKLLDVRPELDYLYSDEDKRDPQGRLVQPFFKPDWSPDLELSINYVTHFSVFRRSLLERVGAFRTDYDGSQDYDLVLRITEATERIAHVARPLYTWRMVEGSAARSVGAKPHAYTAAQRALADAIDRRGLDAEVLDAAGDAHRVRYRVREGLRVETVRVGERSSPAALNQAARSAAADVLVFLGGDLEPVEPEWLTALLEHAQRPEVGVVGGRLLGPDGKTEHEGVVLGMDGSARAVDHRGYFQLGDCVRNWSAVSGDCLATRSDVFDELGGLDESYLHSFADVDYCLRAGRAGYRVVYTPYAVLRRRAPRPPLDGADEEEFARRWRSSEAADPFYNPNLSLRRPFEPALGEERRLYATLGSATPLSASSRR